MQNSILTPHQLFEIINCYLTKMAAKYPPGCFLNQNRLLAQSGEFI
jgi:hypothetical protein